MELCVCITNTENTSMILIPYFLVINNNGNVRKYIMIECYLHKFIMYYLCCTHTNNISQSRFSHYNDTRANLFNIKTYFDRK